VVGVRIGFELVVRAVSYHGHPSQEAVGLNGQSLWRIQINGLKIANKIQELEPSVWHNVKPPKAKPKVQRKKEHPTLLSIQNNPSNLTAKILSFFYFFCKKKSMATRLYFWVSIHVRPKLPSRVHCPDKKILPCRHLESNNHWTLASSERV
jgi:hypothetical protein